MTDDNTDEFLPQDPADKLRAPSNSPFSLPGDEEPPAAGLEGMLVQAEIDAHIFDLKTLEKNSQKKSIQKMVDMGPSAVEPLCVYLKHPDRWARMMAAEVLGKIHDPRAIPALKEALNDQHQGVRYMSELALKEITSTSSLDQGTPAKGKDGQGKPPMPAKVTARLHPVESRKGASAPKTPAAESPKPPETDKPEAKAEPEPKPKPAPGLPEPNIPENLPEIKTLEPRVVSPPAAVVPVVTPTEQPVALPIVPPPAAPQILQGELPPAIQPPTPVAEEPKLPDGLFPFDAPEIAVVGIQSDSASMDQPEAKAWSQEQSSACPVCNQQIKADTRVCPHCHAKFDVSLKGFCPNCRKSVEIDPFDHHCPRCGEEVIDQRYESKLVAYGDIKPGSSLVQKPESYPVGSIEGIIPSVAGVEENILPGEPPESSQPQAVGEFPPIEDPALQEFAERYLAPEYENESAPSGDQKSDFIFEEKTPYPPKEPAFDEGVEYIQPGSMEFPPAPEVPPLVKESSPIDQNLPPKDKPAEEPARIRPMFTAAAVSGSQQDDYGAQPAVPNVRRYAQEGGTPIYVPGQDDGISSYPAFIPAEEPEESKPQKQGKPKPQEQKPKPVRKKTSPPQPVEDESQPSKKVEAVFTAEDFYLYGNSLVPPEKTPPAGKKAGQEEPEGRGINPWLIAAPLFLIAAGMIYLLYFKATGKEAPYIPSILATEPLPTETFTPEPTVKPTVIVPGWVTGFSTPILAAVQNKKPDFFDNFSVPDPQWGFRDGNKPALGAVTLQDEALLMAILRDYGMARQRKVNFNHFAETYDIQFGQNDQSVFEEVFTGSYGSWALHMTNTGENWEGTIKQQDPKTEEWKAAQSGSIPAKDAQKASLTIMRNGNRIAVLVDGEPFIYYEDATLPKTMFHDYYFYRGASQGKVQMLLDNIRIWNLDKFQNLPN
jgi:hypothetical protein